MTENNNNKNKKNVIFTKNAKCNYNEFRDNFINLNENEVKNNDNIEVENEFHKHKKQRLSLVFGIGEKSPFKFNDKVLGNDLSKYISPTITPDNRKDLRKKEINFSNQQLISPLEEEHIKNDLKIKNTTQKEKEKKKITKTNKNDILKKKGKVKYELHFEEAKHFTNEILKFSKEINTSSNLINGNSNKYKDNIVNNNENLSKKLNHNPIDIIILDENDKEKNIIDGENKILEDKIIENFDNKKQNFCSKTNDNVCFEPEPLSADLFKDTDEDILLLSKLSDDNNEYKKNENNDNLISDDSDDIIISSLDMKAEKEKQTIVLDLSSHYDDKDNIKIDKTPNSNVVASEKKELSNYNYVDSFNFDNYENQMIIDNSQNDDLIFDNSQINEIENNINFEKKMHSLNDFSSKETSLEDNKKLPLLPNNDDLNKDKMNLKLKSQNNEKIKHNNALIMEEGTLKKLGESPNKNENILLDVMKNKNVSRIDSNSKIHTELEKSKYKKGTTNNYTNYSNNCPENALKLQHINIISNTKNSDKLENPKIEDEEKSNNKNRKMKFNKNFNSNLSNKLKNDFSLLLSNNYFSRDNNNFNKNKEYSLKINRLKSILIPNKNHKNKEPINDTCCHCLHLNKNVRKVVAGKYANDATKNWLIMETEKSIEIWKYDIHLNSSMNENHCNWTKYSERLKNFCKEIKDIKISPTNEYIVIVGSNYIKKPKDNYYRCGLIIDIYTLNEIYLDIKINDNITIPINENFDFKLNNYTFSKICFPLNEYNIKKKEMGFEEANNKLFIPGYKNGQLIEFTIKKNLSKIESCTYPISKNSSSPLISILSYDNDTPSIIGLMRDKIVIWKIKTKEISSEILLSSIPINENIKLISSIIPPIEYLNQLNQHNNENDNIISNECKNNINNYYSIILYSISNSAYANKEKEKSIIDLNSDLCLKKENFGIYTFLKSILKDNTFYQTSVSGNIINNEDITCYEDSENYIFIGFNSGKIVLWEKNSREISAILNHSTSSNCVVKNSKVLSLSFHYIYPRTLLTNENTPGLLFANYENKKIIVFCIY
ncbi:hypothetical protein BCR36DRAFT_412427 [Piromyces finnis]|uniref:WD40 repeat-like protein n=1 Tax=Piromyces finnis TaxID=1754191 RepID=A0A1Y1VAQ3_9FUNG|nr:hypothetical protein BCR36DRAFT_412427 [Piromyces finnis]|eukprot:ORX50405.1 hypothetical protein BCR36DRAFT_412427 [Piromyces finnis]